MLGLLRRHRVLLLHLSFWGVYFSFYFYQISREAGWRLALANSLVPLVSNLLIGYLNFFYLLPRGLRRQQLGRYLLELAAPFALVVAVRVLVQRQLAVGPMQQSYVESGAFVFSVVVGTLFIVAFLSMLHFVVGWFALDARTRALENEQLTAELKLLKAQINPHFLFNTLNNLYYLAYTQSPNTPEVVAKLAQMMRYMIYESNHATVALSQEIEYMQNYISLEKLRLNAPVPVQFEVEGPVEGVRIAPLLLITFLENAFKHGVSTTDPQAWVTVLIRLRGAECVCTVANGRLPHPAPAPTTAGTGLQNLHRRLALHYPGRHALHVDDGPTEYRVHLTLTLT
ncbi:sensor histidine kinase [Hymenobacter metallicola]|uniref:Sensor histidine kinase n=1 Tax=Hymenobacter metallicola TaxID=2563114 RepID=A0A4Z0Q1D4_9BACT|nr:histidine kinase [Hymenobacter metallicola]TGE23336.1 sensor histidine kinase [Hymenobacter metallicola]